MILEITNFLDAREICLKIQERVDCYAELADESFEKAMNTSGLTKEAYMLKWHAYSNQRSGLLEARDIILDMLEDQDGDICRLG